MTFCHSMTQLSTPLAPSAQRVAFSARAYSNTGGSAASPRLIARHKLTGQVAADLPRYSADGSRAVKRFIESP